MSKRQTSPSLRASRVRRRTSSWTSASTESEWALAYRFDIVLRGRVGNGAQDRVERQERVALEVHLGHESGEEARANREKWMCAGRQALWWLRQG
jgi:hypothetical protein